MPIKNYSTTPSSNNSPPPNGWPEGMAPSDVNNCARQMMADIRSWYQDAQWIDLGQTPTYVSGTSFTVINDQTSFYTVGRRIRLTDTSTLFGTITNSSYSAPNTTVTVALDSGSLTIALSATALGIATAGSLPSISSLQASSSAGAHIRNQSGADVAIFGAGGGTGTSLLGGLNAVGAVAIAGQASGPATLSLAEDTDNGTNTVTVQAPASLASNAVVTLPSRTGTLATDGQLSLGSQSATIASGVITITRGNGGLIIVDTEGAAATDDLDTITMSGVTDGDVIVLSTTASSRDVTVKHATGNITLQNSEDKTLGGVASTLTLVYRGGFWRQVAFNDPSASQPTLVSGTAQATTSGTSKDFTGIPSTAKRITVSWAGVSTNGSDDLLIQLGDSGGVETSGYLCGGSWFATGATSVNSTAGFRIPVQGNASAIRHGSLVLTLLDSASNTWVAAGVQGRSDAAQSGVCGGSKSLSGTLDRVRFTVTGSDTFDAGSVNILYE